jgi:hypothetical protein
MVGREWRRRPLAPPTFSPLQIYGDTTGLAPSERKALERDLQTLHPESYRREHRNASTQDEVTGIDFSTIKTTM